LKSALFKEEYNEMVIVKDIEVYSMCEHHMLPFFGKAHIAYIPNGYVVGLSKIPRVVDVFARRLQVQERLTQEILQAINQTLKPQGCAVVIEAIHMCMMMRGVQKQNSSTTTSAFTGQFQQVETRSEFLSLIGKSLR
jgi:GTP cyclohydrolase I